MVKTETKDDYSYIVVPTVICLLAVALFFIYKYFGVYFSSNDDLLIRSILSGDYTGRPDGHVVYLLYPLGFILKSLYTVAPKVTWYELFCIGAQGLCIIIIASLLAESAASTSQKTVNKKRLYFSLFISSFLFLEILLCFDVGFLIAGQYTVLAGLVAATAFACMLAKKDIMSAVMMVLSLWIRKEAFFMMLPFIAIAIIYRLMTAYETNKKTADNKSFFSAKKIIIAAVIVVISCGSLLINKVAYGSEEWNQYREFNRERTRVYDYNLFPNYSGEKEFYDLAGISEDEYSALVEYDLELVDKVDTTLFRDMADRQKAILDDWKQYYNVFHKLIKDSLQFFAENLKTVHAKMALFSILISFIVMIILVVKEKSFSGLIALILMAAYYVAFVALFTYLGRLPERVIYGLDCAMMLGGIYLTAATLNKLSINKKLIVISASAVLMLVALFFEIRYEFNASTQYRKAAEAGIKIEEYVASHGGEVFYIDTNIFENRVASAEPVYTEGKTYMYEPIGYVKMADWVYGSPLRSQKLESLGTKGLYDANTKRQGYLIISDKISTEFILRLLDEKGFTAIKTDSIESASVWKLQVK